MSLPIALIRITWYSKARYPQSNGICERFHKTVLNEFYRIAFRKKIYNTLDELQTEGYLD